MNFDDNYNIDNRYYFNIANSFSDNVRTEPYIQFIKCRMQNCSNRVHISRMYCEVHICLQEKCLCARVQSSLYCSNHNKTKATI
jgi:hypothetical protein